MNKWPETAFLAAYHGNLEILKWFHTNRPKDLTTGALKDVITGGHLEIAKWVDSKDLSAMKEPADFDNTAFKCVSMAMAEWVVNKSSWLSEVERVRKSEWPSQEERGPCFNIMTANAVKLGSLEEAKYLFKHKVSDVGEYLIMDAAAKVGRLDMTQWRALYLNPATAAACQGHLHVVQWLHANIPQAITRCTMRMRSLVDILR